MSFTGTVAAINTALDGLIFTPTMNYSGPAFLSLSVNDQGNSGLGGPLPFADFEAIKVTPANDTPAGADATIAMAQNTSYAFTAANFGFTDADAGDTLNAVRIDALPAAGTLTFSGVAVTTGQVVAVADIDTGNLVFTPTPLASGAPYASIAFSVQDSAGAFDPASNTMTVNVVPPVNNPPKGTSGTATPSSGIDHIFTVADFGYSDPDAGDLISAVRIDTVSLLLEGTLYFGEIGNLLGRGVGGGDRCRQPCLPPGPALHWYDAASTSASATPTGWRTTSTPNTMTVNVTPSHERSGELGARPGGRERGHLVCDRRHLGDRPQRGPR